MLSVTAVIPAHDEEATVGPIVAAVLATGRVAETVVVDDGSSDRTGAVAAAAGARVVRSAGSVPGRPAGKGAAMRRGVEVATGEVVLFLDADVTGFGAHFVNRLLDPLVHRPELAMSKATYRRDLHGVADEGGRVTELVARPLLARCFPDVDRFRQPLAGEYAVRTRVLRQLTWPDDYGVDVAILIDVTDSCGPDAVVEVDLGHRTHRNRPLAALAVQARQVQDAVLDRYLQGETAETVKVA